MLKQFERNFALFVVTSFHPALILLFFVCVQEILTSIVEQGAKFNQKEYADLLSLQSRSQTIRDNSAHERRLQKLKDIFKK